MEGEVRSEPDEAERPVNGGTTPDRSSSGIALYARMPSIRIGAVVAIAIAAGLTAWLLVRGNDNSKSAKRVSAHGASPGELAALPASVHHPVYWAGPRPGFTYELTRTSDDRIYIRYLPGAIAVGTNKRYLTVGTYPLDNAVAAVRTVARRGGQAPLSISGGGIAAQDVTHPTSVYLAYPGSNYQIEIFDPSPARALRLAMSGKVVPLGSGSGPSQATAAHPKAVTIADLRKLAASVGHPVYWAGAVRGATLEQTQTSDGRIYIRYLPRGVRVGDPHPHLTVGTYPLTDAFAAVEAVSKRPGALRLNLTPEIAVVDPIHPTSVYLAFPGSKYQIEVFDPSPAKSRQVVLSGKMTRIP
jgi:hypothetical protein